MTCLEVQLITAQHLSKAIGEKMLFTDLDIHIGINEKVALIGRNGQDKSILLNIIGGIDTEYSGDIVEI